MCEFKTIFFMFKNVPHFYCAKFLSQSSLDFFKPTKNNIFGTLNKPNKN
jgi:hypothetical protein